MFRAPEGLSHSFFKFYLFLIIQKYSSSKLKDYSNKISYFSFYFFIIF